VTQTLPALPTRSPDAHKGSVGRILVIAGSRGMTGAGALASRGALRSGAGYVTWALPSSLASIAETLCVEAVVLPLPATDVGSVGIEARELLAEASHESDAVVLGPGIAISGETAELIRLLVGELHAPLVLDGGGLTAVGQDSRSLTSRRYATVLTPHPGEMARLSGTRVDAVQADRENMARSMAQRTGSIVLLKGMGTVVTDGERTYVNQTGNPGMATAGAGDVLAGCLAALLGQGMDAFEAAALAAHLHGLAGDQAAEAKGMYGVMAGDILEALPEAFCRYAASD